MSDTDEKILDALISLTKQVDQLAAGQKEIRATQQEQGKDIKSLKEDISTLKTGQEALKKDISTLKLEVELINANQQRAEKQSQRDHEVIIERLVRVADITDKDHKALEKRVDVIEKHLNLPPAK
jgi:chromosome segregation ATPase